MLYKCIVGSSGQTNKFLAFSNIWIYNK